MLGRITIKFLVGVGEQRWQARLATQPVRRADRVSCLRVMVPADAVRGLIHL